MRQRPYFCINCRQYHTPSKPNITRSASVQFLRFPDIFDCTPTTLPLNPNEPSNRNSSRNGCFEGDFKMKNRLCTQCSIMKITQPVVNDGGQKEINKCYNKKQIHNQRMALDKSQLRYNLTSTKKKQVQNSFMKNKPKNKSEKSISQFNYFKKPKRSYQKLIKLHHPQNNPTIIKQPHNKISKIQHSVITKLYENQHKSQQKSKNKQNQSQQAMTQIKKSYVYGEKDRQILTPFTQSSKFKFGQLIESQQQIVDLFKQDNSLYSKSKYSNNKNHLCDTLNSLNITSKKSIKSIPNATFLNYAEQLSKLRQILKSNQKNYSSRTHRPKKQITDFHQQQSNNSINKKYSQITISSSKQKILNKINQNYQNIEKIKICSKQANCKYLDNRCFGLFICNNQEQTSFQQNLLELA